MSLLKISKEELEEAKKNLKSKDCPFCGQELKIREEYDRQIHFQCENKCPNCYGKNTGKLIKKPEYTVLVCSKCDYLMGF